MQIAKCEGTVSLTGWAVHIAATATRRCCDDKLAGEQLGSTQLIFHQKASAGGRRWTAAQLRQGCSPLGGQPAIAMCVIDCQPLPQLQAVHDHHISSSSHWSHWNVCE